MMRRRAVHALQQAAAALTGRAQPNPPILGAEVGRLGGQGMPPLWLRGQLVGSSCTFAEVDLDGPATPGPARPPGAKAR